MRQPSPDRHSQRRQQIIDAATAIIVEQGFQHLSLSEIETRAGISRGQLTYYFPSKEDVCLGVFERLLQLLDQQAGALSTTGQGTAPAEDSLHRLIQQLLARPPAAAEFHALQYTFLSQIGHREDLRQRLAELYESWRTSLASSLVTDLKCPAGSSSARALATFLHALHHGLAIQAAADPEAFDHREMMNLCWDILGTYLRARAATPTNGKAASGCPALVESSDPSSSSSEVSL